MDACKSPRSVVVDDIGSLYIICDNGAELIRVQFPLAEVWKAKAAMDNGRQINSYNSYCPILRLYFEIDPYVSQRREHYWYFEAPEVWTNGSHEILNDEDDLRAYWVVASLPMEVQKQKENFAFRDEVFWWTHFNDTKNNALFHMNGQDYFKEVKKIREFLHDVSSSCALLGDLLWLTAH